MACSRCSRAAAAPGPVGTIWADATIPNATGTKLNTQQFEALAATPAALVDKIADVLTGVNAAGVRAGKWTVRADAFRFDNPKEIRYAEGAKAAVEEGIVPGGGVALLLLGVLVVLMVAVGVCGAGVIAVIALGLASRRFPSRESGRAGGVRHHADPAGPGSAGSR